MECKVCHKTFKDIIRHLKNSNACQNAYDIKALEQDRKLARYESMRKYSKKYHVENKAKICNQSYNPE